MSSIAHKHVAYVLRRFPSLSETFIANEIVALKNTGWQVSIFSLLKGEMNLVDNLFTSLAEEALYPLPAYSFEILKSHLYFLAHSPSKYLRITRESILSQLASTSLVRAIATVLFAVYFARLAQKLEVDHLHAHFVGASASAARVISLLIDVSYSLRIHTRFDVASAARNPWQILSADFIAVDSDNARQELLANVAAARYLPVVLIRQAVDLRRFASIHPQEGKTPVILSVGRFVEQKGFEYLIEACAILKSLGHDFECNIVGYGPLQTRLEAQIKSLGVECVHLTGPVPYDSLGAYYAEAVVFVLSCLSTESGEDGVPTVIVEAMAAGLPVVSTLLAAIPEVVLHERTGLLVPQRDPEALASALGGLLISPTLRHRMGIAARKYVLREFDLQRSTLLLSQRLSESSPPSRTRSFS